MLYSQAQKRAQAESTSYQDGAEDSSKVFWRYLKKIIWLSLFCSLRLTPSQAKSSKTSLTKDITLSYCIIIQTEWVKPVLRNNSSLLFHHSFTQIQTEIPDRSWYKASIGKNTHNTARQSQAFIWESDTVQMEKYICLL